MFEGLVHQLLVGYLGNYVKDLQKEQFRIGLWKGEVLLENVDLVLEAFDYLQLPFAIKQGVIGKLSIKIPWKKLGWDPILIALEDVFICICQRDDSEWSAEAVGNRELAGKKANLAAAELAKLSRRVSDNQAGQSFISYLSAKILDNIQVTIQSVHIRYVDQNPDSRAPFSLGLRFSTLSIMTTDMRYQSSSLGISVGGKTKGGQAHKLVEICDIGLYWNMSERYSNELSIADIHGNHLCPNKTSQGDEFNYVLQPMNATISLMVNKSGRFEGGSPQYAVALELNDLVVNLEDIQIHQMLMLWDSVSICRLREKYGRFRPRSQSGLDRNLIGWQRLWWKYAISAVLSDVHKKLRRTSWSYLGWRISARRKYITLYRLKLECLQQEQPVDDVTLHELEEMEKQLDMDEILNYRSRAETELYKTEMCATANCINSESNGKDIVLEKQHNEEPTSSKPRGWLNWLSLGMLGAGGTTDSTQFTGVISDEVIKDIYEATKYHPVSCLDTGIAVKGHGYLLSISLSVHLIILTLKSMWKKEEIICMKVHGASMASNVWQDSASMSILLNSLQVVDSSANDLPLSCVVSDKKCMRSHDFYMLEAVPGDSNAQFVTIEIDILPQSFDLDLSVKVMFQPFEIIYNASVFEGVTDFFHVLASFQSQLDRVLNSLNGFENVEARVLSKAGYVFSKRKRVSFEANIRDVDLIFPLGNPESNWSRMAISVESVCVGSVVGQNIVTDKVKFGSDNLICCSDAEVEDKLAMLGDFYDHFEIKLSGVQGRMESAKSYISFVQPFDASITIDRCTLPDEPTMNWLRVHGALPSLHILLSSAICNVFKDLGTNLTWKDSVSNNKPSQQPFEVSGLCHHCSMPDELEFGGIGDGNFQNINLGIPLNDQISMAGMQNVLRYKAMIKLDLLFIELCLDDKYQACEEKVSLLAQLGNFNVEAVQRASGYKLSLGMETANIEGPNLAGSPVSCILCSKRVEPIQQSVSRMDDNSGFKLLNAYHDEELDKFFERGCFYLRYEQSREGFLHRPKLKLWLSNLDYHCYPKITGRLHKFFHNVVFQESSSSGARIVVDIPAAETEREEITRQSGFKTEGLNFYSTRANFEGSLDTMGIPFEQSSFVWNGHADSSDRSIPFDASKATDFASTDKIRSEECMEACRKLLMQDNLGMLQGATTMDDSVGVDNTDASGRKDYNASSKYENDGTDLQIELELHCTKIHFHDSVCALATVVIPKSRLSVSIFSDRCSWDLRGSVMDIRLLSSWAAAPHGEVLWGPLFQGPCPMLSFRVRKKEHIFGYSELEMRFSVQHVQCILSSDFLAVVIGYFASDWDTNLKMQSDPLGREDNVKSESTGFKLQYKVEVIDSMLILPVEHNGFVKVGLPQLFFSFLPSYTIPNKDGETHNEGIAAASLGASRMHSIDVAGRKLSFSFVSVSDHEQGSHRQNLCYATGSLPLIEQLDAELSVRIPHEYPFAPMSIVLSSECFKANVSEISFGSGLEAIVDIARELSVVGKRSRLFVSSVSQFMQSKLEFKSSHAAISKVSKESFVDLKCFVSKILLEVHSSRQDTLNVVELIGKADAQRLKFSGLWRNELLETLAVDISSLHLFSPSNYESLLKCMSKDSSCPGVGVLLSTLPSRGYEASVALPCVDIWVDLSAWIKIALFVTSCIKSRARGTEHIALSQSLDKSASDTMNLTDAAQLCTGKSDSDAVGLLRPFHLKSETLGICFHIPDFASQDEVLHSVGETNSQQGVCQDGSFMRFSNEQRDCAVFEGKLHKFVSFSLSVRVDELILIDHNWNLKAAITKIEGKLETVQEQHVHCLPFCHMAEVEVKGAIYDENLERLHVILDIQMDTVDFWFSYPILCFWQNFNFGASNQESPMVLELSLDVGVGIQKAASLLSDERWSCNAPIMELFLKHVSAHAKWSDGTVEASVSCELQINYHNLHKVTWEPFLEPWTMKCWFAKNFECCGLLNTLLGTNVHIESSSQLNLNLTEALMQAAVRGIEMIKDTWNGMKLSECPGNYQKKYSPHGIVHTRQYAAYFLQNDTCMPLNFWLVHGPLTADNNEILDRAVRNTVEPGFSVPLFVEEASEELFCRRRTSHSSERLPDQKSSGSQHHMISIQLEGTSRASMPMSMDFVGMRSFEADFSKSSVTSHSHEEDGRHKGIGMQEEKANMSNSNAKFIVPVIFEVSEQQYSKLIRLYSTVTLVNATSLPMEVRFDIPFGISPMVMDPILPGQELPLPVHLAETGRMRWRPLGSSYLWSETQSLANIISQENRLVLLRSFLCYPSHPSNGPFRCCISVQEIPVPSCHGMKQDSLCSQDRSTGRHSKSSDLTGNLFSSNGTKNSHIRRITLTAPLVVKNCLPITLQLSIENGAGVTVNAFAPEGDAVSLFDIDSVHDLGIAFRISGFLPSFVKFPRSTLYNTELGKVDSHVENILSVETLMLSPDSTNGLPVFVKVEKAVDAFCGARELCLSVPFWLYNCTGLILGVMDGDVDQKVGERIVYPSYYALKLEESITRKSGMAIACIDLSKTPRIQNEDTFGRIYRQNWDMPCKIRSHLPCQKLVSSHLSAEDSTRGTCKLSEHSTPGFSGISSVNEMHGWQRRGSHMAFSDGTDSCIEVDGRGVDQLPKPQACMHSPAEGIQTAEPMFRMRISQSKHVESAVQEGAWSDLFSLNPSSGSTTVIIPQPYSCGSFIISLISTPVLGACGGRTRAITFQPRYVISNACNRDICYKQKGTDSCHRLGVGEHFHLHWTDTKRELLVSIRFDEPGWDWSGGFLPDQLGDTQVKMRNHVTSALQMVRIEVQNANIAYGDNKSVENPDGSLATYLILLSNDDTGFMPYRIDNFTLERLRFYQQKCEKFENIVQPYTYCSYAWDEPCHPHRLIVEIPGEGVIGAYGLDEVRDYASVYLPATSEKSERRLFMSVHAEGPIKVLSITDANMHTVKGFSGTSLYRFGEKLTATNQSQDYFLDVGKKITVCLSFIGLSIIDSIPQELAFACAKGVKIEISQGLHQQKFLLQISSVQIDNQLRHALYPVMVSTESICNRTLTFEDKMNQGNPYLKGDRAVDPNYEASHEAAFCLSAAKWRNMATSVDCFEYITMRLAPLRLELEEQMVVRLVDFIKGITWRFWKGSMHAQSFEMWPWNYGMDQVTDYFAERLNFEFVRNPHSTHLHLLKVKRITESYRSWPLSSAVRPIGAPWQKIFLLARRRKKIYVDTFHISPIKLTVSFSSTPWLPKDVHQAAPRSSMWISGTSVQRGLMALVDIEGAPIYLRQLSFSHPLASWDAIQGMVLRHYTRQLLHEVYKVLGSAGVFGNPMGFARNLGLGIRDFISVPAKSIVQNPTGLITGVAQGTKSLLNNTVFAVSNAATQFSKAARKGVAAFAFDEEFVAEMERRQQGSGSHNKGILNEFLEGLTNLLQSPIRGAEKHGLPGVLSGIFIGAAGLIARPVVSILEVAGRTAQSIRNRSNPRQLNHFRVRFPRPLTKGSPLQPYSWEEAVGMAVLQEVESNQLKDEVYVTCMALEVPGMFVVVTERLLLKVKSRSLAAAASPEINIPVGPEWNIQLEIVLGDIIHVDSEGRSLNILASSPHSYFRRPKDVRTLKQSPTPQGVPLIQETIEFMNEDAAQKLLCLIRSLIDDIKDRPLQSVLKQHSWR